MKLLCRLSLLIITVSLDCAMTGYGHAELVSASCGLNPSPAFQAPSAQGRQGHTHRTALRFPLSPQVARGTIRSIGNMKENIFSNMVYSLFTSHHSLINNDTVFSPFTFHFSLFTISGSFCSRLCIYGFSKSAYQK